MVSGNTVWWTGCCGQGAGDRMLGTGCCGQGAGDMWSATTEEVTKITGDKCVLRSYIIKFL